MTRWNYLKDRMPAFVIWLVCCALTIIFLLAFRASGQLVLAVTVVDGMAVIFHEIWNYSRKKKFYQRIGQMTEELDQKYLLPEMMQEPDFYEGRLLYAALIAFEKSMAENVNRHKKQASDFRDYIEMWVHEVKLPVASLQLMNHNNPGRESEKANVQLKRIDDCIDNVLYYARSENAQKDYLIKEVSLQKVFSGAALRNREALGLMDGSLKTSGLERMVLTDGKWLGFILGQLMANSIKYASPDRPLCIEAVAEDFEAITTFHFRDNGIGILESDLPYVFEKSFTGQNGRIGSASTGMGLYIVKSLCECLGHGIHIYSQQGAYTEVVITFPKNDYYRMQ